MSQSSSSTIILTGANCGIGFETCKVLCQLGHDMVISVRDDAKGQATISAIKAEIPAAKIMYLIMDLSDPVSIRAFVDAFHKTGKSLHVLINNAGVFQAYKDATRVPVPSNPDSEMTMAVNCMGPFLLTNLLLDDLKTAGTEDHPARIVNVSSMITTMASKGWEFDIEDIMLTKPDSYKSGFQAYKCSKIALNLWSNELSRRLADKQAYVIVNTLCPGFIPSTNLGRNNPSFLTSIVMWLFDTFIGRWLIHTKPATEGARLTAEMAVDSGYGMKSGLFYRNGAVYAECSEVCDVHNQEKIWEICERYSGLSS